MDRLLAGGNSGARQRADPIVDQGTEQQTDRNVVQADQEVTDQIADQEIDQEVDQRMDGGTEENLTTPTPDAPEISGPTRRSIRCRQVPDYLARGRAFSGPVGVM